MPKLVQRSDDLNVSSQGFDCSRCFGGLCFPRVTAYIMSWPKDCTRVVTLCATLLLQSGSPVRRLTRRRSSCFGKALLFTSDGWYGQGVGAMSSLMADRICEEV